MPFFRYEPKVSFFKYGNKKVKVGGYIPDKEDANDKHYSASRYRTEELPARVDLREYMSPVENQGTIGSCTANSMAGAYEYLAMRALGTTGDVSRLFIYYNARYLDGQHAEDSGTTLRNCIQILQEMGACLEPTWPYDPEMVHEEPHTDAYDEAARFLIEEAERVDVNLNAMKHCLAEGYPFAFGLQLFSSFEQAGTNGGIVPIPLAGETHDGGHAMLCVGYSDQDQMFVVRNSWGTDWGDNGYCYIPYDYMTHPELCADCWTIKAVSDVDFSEGVWQEEGSFFDEIIPLVADYLDIEDEEEDEEYEEEEEEEEEYEEEEEEEEDGGGYFNYQGRR